MANRTPKQYGRAMACVTCTVCGITALTCGLEPLQILLHLAAVRLTAHVELDLFVVCFACLTQQFLLKNQIFHSE